MPGVLKRKLRALVGTLKRKKNHKRKKISGNENNRPGSIGKIE
jgi:hypothetical protein